MITIQINDNIKAGKELINFLKELPYVKIDSQEKNNNSQQILKMKDSLSRAIKEVKEIENLKKNPKNLIDFLNEL